MLIWSRLLAIQSCKTRLCLWENPILPATFISVPLWVPCCHWSLVRLVILWVRWATIGLSITLSQKQALCQLSRFLIRIRLFWYAQECTWQRECREIVIVFSGFCSYLDLYQSLWILSLLLIFSYLWINFSILLKASPSWLRLGVPDLLTSFFSSS